MALDAFKIFTYATPPPESIATLTTRAPTPSPPAHGLWEEDRSTRRRERSASASSTARLRSTSASSERKVSGASTVTKVKDKIRRKGRASREPSRERSASPPARHAPKLGRLQPPRDKKECLTRFVFPILLPPRHVGSLYTADVLAALKTLSTGTIKIQYHAGMSQLLQNQLDHVRAIPPVPKQSAPYEYDYCEEAEMYASSIETWVAAEHEMAEYAVKAHRDERHLIDGWFDRLVQPLNDLIDQPDTFRPDRPPRYPTRWAEPSAIERSHRQHDWVAWSDDGMNTCRAVLSWRLAASDADIGMLYAKAVSCRPTNWKLDVGPGFQIHQRGGELILPEGMQWGAAAVALLVSQLGPQLSS